MASSPATAGDEQMRCVQCSRDYREEENRDDSCTFHCQRPSQLPCDGTLSVWYPCCPEVSSPELHGCCKGKHRDRHHAEYPYASYLAKMEEMSTEAKELWMEIVTLESAQPEVYQWAEVGLSERDTVYIIVGTEERSVEYSEFTIEQLRQWNTTQATAFERKDASGWTALLEIVPVQDYSNARVLNVTLTPAPPAFLPVSKSLTVYLDGSIPRHRSLSRDVCYHHLNTASVPQNTYEGTDLELDVDYHDWSRGRRNDYCTETEDGCTLNLLQEGKTVAFSRYSNTSAEKWDNVFSTRIRIINASEGSVTITAVSGEYLSHRGEWIRCDDTLVTKDFFPGMYKWSFSTKNYVSLAPGFEDTLNTNLSISFPGYAEKPSPQGHAHPSLPQPLHLRLGFTTKDNRTVSLRFEQGNPASLPSRELRERELERELEFYVCADDRHQMTRADAFIYYGTLGQLLYSCSTGGPLSHPTSLWPHLHFVVHQAKRTGCSECELSSLSKVSNGVRIRVSALVNLKEEVTRALKVEIQTHTSKATSYYLVPYINPLRAELIVEPKRVLADEEFTVRWNVPRATPSDSIIVYEPHGRSLVAKETNWKGLDQGHAKMKVPSPGFYKVGYLSPLLTAQSLSQHRRYLCSGTVIVMAT